MKSQEFIINLKPRVYYQFMEKLEYGRNFSG